MGWGGGRGRCRGSERTAPGSASAQGIRTPRFSGPGFPATVLRGKGAFPGARQHPPWCSRPPKVPVVRVLSSYKLGVRLGRVSLQLTRLGGDCPLPPVSSLPQTSMGHMGRGPLLPPAGRSGAGALHAFWGSARHSHLPCSRARPGSLRRSAAAPTARARGDAGTLRAARHPPGVAQRQHGTAAPGCVRVLAQATGLCRLQPCPLPAPVPGQAGHRAEP